MSFGEGGMFVEGWPCRVFRGDAELGTITHDSREDGGPCEVAWLVPAPAFDAIRDLFAEEFRLVARRCEAESGSAAAAELESRLAEVQRAIMASEVRLV